MRKLLLPLLLFVMTLVNAQTTEVFQYLGINTYNRSTKTWTVKTDDIKSEYFITLDTKSKTMIVLRAFDNKSMNFVQVSTFRMMDSNYFMWDGLLVAEDNSKFPAVGFISDTALILNLGDMIYTFTKEEESKTGKL